MRHPPEDAERPEIALRLGHPRRVVRLAGAEEQLAADGGRAGLDVERVRPAGRCKPRSSGSKMSRRSSSRPQRSQAAVVGGGRVDAESLPGEPGAAAERAAAGDAGTASALQSRGPKDTTRASGQRRPRWTRIRSGRDAAARRSVLAELAGADQPALQPGRWAPSTSDQRSSPTIATAGRRQRPGCATAAAKNAGLGLPATRPAAPVAYSSAATNGPASSARRVALPEVAVARERHERGAGHQVLERLLQQRERPALAQVAQHDGVRRAAGRRRRAADELETRQVLERAGRDERRDRGDSPAARISVDAGERGGDDLLGRDRRSRTRRAARPACAASGWWCW